MKIERKKLLVGAAVVGVSTILPRLVQAALLRFTSTIVRDETHSDRRSSAR